MKFIVFFYHTTLFRCNQELIGLKEMYLHFCFFFLSPISCQYMKILYQHISKIIASMQEKRIWRTQWQPKIYSFAEAMFSWQYNHKEQNAFSWDSFSLALYPDISRAEGGIPPIEQRTPLNNPLHLLRAQTGFYDVVIDRESSSFK